MRLGWAVSTSEVEEAGGEGGFREGGGEGAGSRGPGEEVAGELSKLEEEEEEEAGTGSKTRLS